MRKMKGCPKKNPDLMNFEILVDFEKCHARPFQEALIFFFKKAFFILYMFVKKIIVIVHER